MPARPGRAWRCGAGCVCVCMPALSAARLSATPTARRRMHLWHASLALAELEQELIAEERVIEEEVEQAEVSLRGPQRAQCAVVGEQRTHALAAPAAPMPRPPPCARAYVRSA